MADNVGYTPGTGSTVAADDIAGVLHQRVKVVLGADGVNDGDLSSANPLPVSLPATAATAAKQDTGNTSLASLDGKAPALGQALAASSVPVVLTAAQVTTLTPYASVGVTGSVSVTGTFWQSTQPVSAATLPLPADASTATLQTSGNASLTTIAAKDFATEATLNDLTIAQGTTVSSTQTGPMVQGVVSDVSEGGYLDATIRPLSLNTDGRLRVTVVEAVTHMDFFVDSSCNRVNPEDYNAVWAINNSPWSSLCQI